VFNAEIRISLHISLINKCVATSFFSVRHTNCGGKIEIYIVTYQNELAMGQIKTNFAYLISKQDDRY